MRPLDIAPLGLACVLLTVLAGTVRAEGEADARTIRLDHSLAVTAPEGWSLDEPGEDPGDATGRRRVRLVCGTPACRRTQEVCTLYLRRDPVEGAGDDAARLDALYAAPTARYTRLRDALTSTSRGATLRGAFAKVRLGPHPWYAVETEAAPGFKSGLFAATVIGGRYLGAICKTCETGEIRHAAARALLASARRTE